MNTPSEQQISREQEAELQQMEDTLQDFNDRLGDWFEDGRKGPRPVSPGYSGEQMHLLRSWQEKRMDAKLAEYRAQEAQGHSTSGA